MWHQTVRPSNAQPDSLPDHTTAYQLDLGGNLDWSFDVLKSATETTQSHGIGMERSRFE